MLRNEKTLEYHHKNCSIFLRIFIKWLFSTLFQPAFLLKEGLRHRCFSVNFAKILRCLFYKAPQGGCFWKKKKCSPSNCNTKLQKEETNNFVILFLYRSTKCQFTCKYKSTKSTIRKFSVSIFAEKVNLRELTQQCKGRD